MVFVGRDDVDGMFGVTGGTPRDLLPVGAVGHHPVPKDAVFTSGGGKHREEPAAAGVDVGHVVERGELGVRDLCRAADYAEPAREVPGQDRFGAHLRGIIRRG